MLKKINARISLMKIYGIRLKKISMYFIIRNYSDELDLFRSILMIERFRQNVKKNFRRTKS